MCYYKYTYRIAEAFMSDTYRANPRVKLKKTKEKDTYSGTPASYDVFVDGVLVGRLRGTYSRIAGTGQHFEGKDGSRNGFSGVRGVYRKHLDRAAIAAHEALLAQEAASR